jgi:hypothetical protein
MSNVYHRQDDRTSVEFRGRKKVGFAGFQAWSTRLRIQCALATAILTIPLTLVLAYFAVLQHHECHSLLDEHNWKPVKVIVKEAKVECDDDGYWSLYVDFTAPDNGRASEELVNRLTKVEATEIARGFKKGTCTKAYQNDNASSRKVALRPKTVINRASAVFWLLVGGTLGTVCIGGAILLYMVDSLGDCEGLRFRLKRLAR